MSRFMMKFTLAAFIVAVFAASSFAQDEGNMAKPLEKSGSAAFVFDLGGLATFGIAPQAISQNQSTALVDGAGSVSFAGGPIAGVGAKWYIADMMAVKVLLAFSAVSNGDTTTSKHATGTTLGIGATFEYHFHDVYSTSPYVGGGIKFATSSTTVGSDANNQVKNSGSEFNIGVVAGFDWFFTKGLALGAEYGFGYTTNSSSNTTTLAGKSTTTDGSSPNTIALSITKGITGAGSVHLLVYF